jgi:hypothetical protein
MQFRLVLYTCRILLILSLFSLLSLHILSWVSRFKLITLRLTMWWPTLRTNDSFAIRFRVSYSVSACLSRLEKLAAL